MAPVEYVGGWSLLAAIGTGFAVLTADTFAFHARARGEALVPGAVLFVFVAALGADRHRIGLTLALIATGFLAAALLRTRFAQPPRTSLGRPRHPLAVTLPAAALAGTAIVLGAWIIGPRLPGAGAEPLVDTRNDAGGVTEVLSPLVDIRTRLVNRRDTELFTVTSPRARVLARERAARSSTATRGACPTARSRTSTASCRRRRPARRRTSRRSRSPGCAASSCPAAAEPVRASGDGLRWNAETSTLVRVDRELEDGRPLRRRVGDAELLAGRPARGVVGVATGPDLPRAAGRLPAVGRRDGQRGHGRRRRRRTTRCSPCRTGSAPSSSTASTSRRATAPAPSRRSCASASATASSSPARSRRWPARSASRHASPSATRRGWCRPTAARRCSARTPTPGRRSGSTGSAGCRSSRPPAAASPAPRTTPAWRRPRTSRRPGPGTEGAGAGGDAPPVTLPPELVPSDPLLDPSLIPTPGADRPGLLDAGPRPARRMDWRSGSSCSSSSSPWLPPAIVRRWRRAHPSADVPPRSPCCGGGPSARWRRPGCRVDPTLTPLEQARAVSPRLPVAARPLKSLAEVATAATYATADEIAHLADPGSPASPDRGAGAARSSGSPRTR